MSPPPRIPASLPALLWRLLKDPVAFPLWVAREIGPVAELPMPGRPALILSDPKLIEEVLVTHHKAFIKDIATRQLAEVMGQGLLVSEGAFWKRQRRLIQPAFQPKRLTHYADAMVGQALGCSEVWPCGTPLDLHREFARLTLAIVAETLFGTSISQAEAETVGAALQAIMDRYMGLAGTGVLTPRGLPTPGNLRCRKLMPRLDAILLRIISERRKSGALRDDLLGRLIQARDEDGSQMTDQQLRDECVTLFIAGHETTALALSYATWLLAQHPAAQARLHEELRVVLAGRAPTFADFEKLSFTQAILKESMRLYPPAWAIGREPISEVVIGGYTLPKGLQVWIATNAVHRDPRWYAEPDSFRPERWVDGSLAELGRYHYLPFGAGPRVCIGNHFAMLESVLCLAVVFQRFRVEPTSSEPLTLMGSVTLRPKGGVWLRLQRHVRDSRLTPHSPLS